MLYSTEVFPRVLARQPWCALQRAMGVGTVHILAHSLVPWWHRSDFWAALFLNCGGARINYLFTQRLPISHRHRRNIYVINVPAAQQRLPGAFVGSHLTFAPLRRHMDYFRRVQVARFVSVIAHT